MEGPGSPLFKPEVLNDFWSVLYFTIIKKKNASNIVWNFRINDSCNSKTREHNIPLFSMKTYPLQQLLTFWYMETMLPTPG